MGRFGGVEKAQPSEGGVWVIPGVYDVEVLKCKAGTSRKKQDFFVAELEVISSNNPERPVGSRMSWMATLKEDTPALGDVRAFIATAEKTPLKDVTEEVCDYVVGEANPLKGKRLHLVATNIKTRSGGDFTKAQWDAYADDTKAAATA